MAYDQSPTRGVFRLPHRGHRGQHYFDLVDHEGHCIGKHMIPDGEDSTEAIELLWQMLDASDPVAIRLVS